MGPVARFEGDSSRVDQAVDAVRGRVESGDLPEGLEGAQVMLFVNRESGSMLGITLYDSEEAVRRGNQALGGQPGEAGRRASVEFYEVPFSTM